MTIDCTKINVKKGSKGNNVKEVQKYLKYYGYYDGNIDGDCGNYTTESIKKFQKANDLVVDGVFGKLSCQKSNINGKDISSSDKTIPLKTWKDITTRFENYKKQNGREPNICYIDKKNPYEYITLSKYKDMKTRFDEWIKNNKTEPNYLYINKTNKTNSTKDTNNTTSYTSSPHYESKGCNQLGQCTSYWCGPHSLHQILKKFGITKYNEKTLAGYMGTTTNGTGHEGINTAIAKIATLEKITLKVEWKNFSDMGKTLEERFKKLGELFSQKNKGVIVHLNYRNKYGHYETNKTINTKNKTLTVLNSLGNKCTSTSYCGYLETRSFSDEASYIANTYGGQPSICIITKQ